MSWKAVQFDRKHQSWNLQLIQDDGKIRRHAFRSKTYHQLLWGEAQSAGHLFHGW